MCNREQYINQVIRSEIMAKEFKLRTALIVILVVFVVFGLTVPVFGAGQNVLKGSVMLENSVLFKPGESVSRRGRAQGVEVTGVGMLSRFQFPGAAYQNTKDDTDNFRRQQMHLNQDAFSMSILRFQQR